MANGYEDGLTIDRIDNTQGYSPLNCRWVDYTTQENNRTNNILYEVDGEVVTLAQLSRREGVSRWFAEKRHKEELVDGK